MKAIVNTRVGQVDWLEWPKPEPGPGQVRIRTAACGICASDIEIIAGSMKERVKLPAILGHEWSGTVEAVGPGVDAGLVGSPCVGENVLARGGEIGFEHPGGYGEFFITEARNIRGLPEAFHLTAAVLIEPLAVCVRGVTRLGAKERRAALVIGDGAIGLLSVALLKYAGIGDIVCVGGRPARLELAKALGASRVLNYHEARSGLAEMLRREQPEGFPNVIEASGSASGMAAGFECAAKCGKVVIIGDYGSSRADFPWNAILHRELEIIGSDASAGAWERAVQLAVSGQIPLHMLISARFPACEFEKALGAVRNSRETAKVIMQW